MRLLLIREGEIIWFLNHSSLNHNRLEFKHDLFVRGQPQQLPRIKRRKSVKRETEDQHAEERKVERVDRMSPQGTPALEVSDVSQKVSAQLY